MMVCTTSCKEKLNCNQHYTYSARKINIKGISANLKKAGVDAGDIAIGEILIDPEYTTASDRLQELDLIQFALCGQIRGLESDNPLRSELVSKYTDALLKMLEVAQNPDDIEP